MLTQGWEGTAGVPVMVRDLRMGTKRMKVGDLGGSVQT